MWTLAKAFAGLLEEYGYQDALRLVEEELVPLSRSQNITLLEAAYEYADGDEELDTTSWGDLYYTLQGMNLGTGIPMQRLKPFDVRLDD